MESSSERRSIGVPTINSLPANRSLILADSRFRPDSPLDEPYNFLCDLGGSGIYAKEFFYQNCIGTNLCIHITLLIANYYFN